MTLETQRDDLCCFLLDGIILLPITARTRRDGASLRRAATARSARNGARLLPPTDAIMSSGRLEQLNILNMIMPVRRKARAASAAEGASGADAAEGASGAVAAEGASGAAAAEAERNPHRRPALAPPCETD